jgi:predicted RNA-binding protein with RPS1 domain
LFEGLDSIIIALTSKRKVELRTVGVVLTEGQEVKVKLMGFDDRGKVRLSMKVVDQETGEEISNDG